MIKKHEYKFIVSILPSDDQESLGARISGGRLNIKMSSYLYMDPHVKDKMVLRPSYL